MRTLPPLPNEAQPKENTHPVHNGTIEDAVKLPSVTKTSQLGLNNEEDMVPVVAFKERRSLRTLTGLDEIQTHQRAGETWAAGHVTAIVVQLYQAPPNRCLSQKATQIHFSALNTVSFCLMKTLKVKKFGITWYHTRAQGVRPKQMHMLFTQLSWEKKEEICIWTDGAHKARIKLSKLGSADQIRIKILFEFLSLFHFPREFCFKTWPTTVKVSHKAVRIKYDSRLVHLGLFVMYVGRKVSDLHAGYQTKGQRSEVEPIEDAIMYKIRECQELLVCFCSMQ